MKRFLSTTALVLLVAFTSLTFAVNSKITKDHPRYAQIEKNLLTGLSSSQNQIKANSAIMLANIDSERALVPLQEVMNNAQDEDLKQAVKLALIKLTTKKDPVIVQGSYFQTQSDIHELIKKHFKVLSYDEFKAKKSSEMEVAVFFN